MAVRRRRGLGVAALALFILAVLSGSAVARAEEDGVSNPDAGLDGAFGADADPIAVDDDDASDELPTSRGRAGAQVRDHRRDRGQGQR